MKIVILGHNSFVGTALLEYVKLNWKCDVVLVGRKPNSEFNVHLFEVPEEKESLYDSTLRLVESLEIDEHTVIVNCISLGDVDKCEKDTNKCEIQNYLFVKCFYDLISPKSFNRFVHLSTNAVYDGENAPYSEKSVCRPVNFYGRTKIRADEYLLDKSDQRVTVLRPITMYGSVPKGGRSNPVSMIIERLKNNESLKLVDDVFVNILFVTDLVKLLKVVVDKNVDGLINVSGDEIYSRYELGIEIARLLALNKGLISRVSSSEFQTVAERPLDTSFDNRLMKELGVIPTSLAEGVKSIDL